jgi:hypothetical protein
LGLSPVDGSSYLQPFDLLVGEEELGSELQVGSMRLKHPEAVFNPDWLGAGDKIEGQGVYVGYGVVGEDRDDYAGADPEGKIVFVIPGVPTDWSEDREKALMARLKNEVALRRGAAAVVSLRIEDDAEAWQRRSRGTPMALSDGTTSSFRSEVTVGPEGSRRLLTAWGLDPEEVKELAEEGSEAKLVGPVSLVRSHQIGRTQSWNVIGVLRGSDPNLRDEAVVYTAHLDHVGMGEPDEEGDRIFNGAHDNALGVAKMLAAAEALVDLEPRRSVVFAAVGAEEKGLLGSWFYVKNPVLPIENTAAAINHDGGRDGDAVDDFLTIGASFSTLEETLTDVAQDEGVRVAEEWLPPLSPSTSLLLRSDHRAFILAGVPAVYLMDGYSVDGDVEKGQQWWEDYLDNVNHKQRDHFSTGWSLESAVRMARLSARLGLRLANQEEKPRLHDDALIKRARGVPVEPYFYSDELAFLTKK